MKLETTVTLDDQNKVTSFNMTSVAGGTSAVQSEADPEMYEYASYLDGDDRPIVSDKLLTLADVVIATHVHHGVIPPQNFDTIPCSNKH